MASFTYSLLFIVSILISSSSAQNGLILPLHKDPKTTQFYTTLQFGSNRAPMTPIIDLSGQSSWFSCDNFTSSSYAPILCDTRKCEIAKGIGCVGCNGPERPGCTNNTCAASANNPFQNVQVAEGYGEDTLYVKNQRPVPEYTFSCMETRFMEGLASGTNGLIGLARTETSIHKQVANKFNLPDKFSVCFPSSSGLGKLSIGGPSATAISEISKSLRATPLITPGPANTLGDLSEEYFIDVKSIRVNSETLSLKSSYFAIDKNGFGGTKISSINNYTAVHNSIYKPLTRAFTKAASDMKIKRVAAVQPFRACFSSASISKTPSGPSVPVIDLVLPGKDVYWRINGANLMVDIDSKTTCLAIVDGGSNPRTSIVIGAHQLEENYLEFDLVSSQLRFSSSLLVQHKSCSRL